MTSAKVVLAIRTMVAAANPAARNFNVVLILLFILVISCMNSS